MIFDYTRASYPDNNIIQPAGKYDDSDKSSA